MATSWYDLVLLFAIYSMIGWVCESIWCSVGTRKLVNRGFLNGPYCPIYGFGALLILIVCEPIKAYPVAVFFAAMLAASILEYFTGWLLETLFHQKWWDYSKRKWNLKGRVCLRNALLFGLMGFAATYFLVPPAERLMQLIPAQTQRFLAIGFLAVFALDLTHTLLSMFGLRQRLSQVRADLQEMERFNREHGWYDRHDLAASAQRLRALCEASPDDASAQNILKKLDALTAIQQRGQRRLLKAFPNLSDKDFGAELRALREGWQRDIARRKEARRARKGHKRDE